MSVLSRSLQIIEPVQVCRVFIFLLQIDIGLRPRSGSDTSESFRRKWVICDFLGETRRHLVCASVCPKNKQKQKMGLVIPTSDLNISRPLILSLSLRTSKDFIGTLTTKNTLLLKIGGESGSLLQPPQSIFPGYTLSNSGVRILVSEKGLNLHLTL